MTTEEIVREPRRHHAIGGTHNFRDVGGYRAEGGRTRWGKLFRSDALHRVDDAGLAMIADLGLARVFDLRSSPELVQAPSALGPLTSAIEHMPIFEEIPVVSGMTDLYLRFVEEHGPQFVRVVRAIAESGDTPVLVHCTAGKDRTGVVIALALLGAGVDRDDVLDDYAATAGYLIGAWTGAQRRLLEAAGIDVGEDDALIAASPRELMKKILEHIDARYGSVHAYLDRHGLDADGVARLRAVLVEATPAPAGPGAPRRVSKPGLAG